MLQYVSYELTRRTNILFDEATWGKLKSSARQKSTSVGELVRQAVREAYDFDSIKDKALTAINTIKTHRKSFKHLNYKSLINAGRKY